MSDIAANKPGNTWISKRTGQFRYSANGQKEWVQPLSIYTAAVAIQRGQLVSIVLDSNSGDYPGVENDADSLVELTDTSKHNKVVGIAGNNALAGEAVHIQSWGRFKYEISKATEYWPSFVDNLSRGKLLYAGPTSGSVTHDEIEAVLGNRNLITVGYVSDTAETGVGDVADAFTVEIQLEADGRGPLGVTQFEFELGEDLFHKDFGNDNEVTRILAVGRSSAYQAYGTIRIKKPTVWPTGGQWIGVYSPRKAVILAFGSTVSATGESLTRYNIIENFSHTVDIVPLHAGTAPADWMDPTLDDGTFELYNGGGTNRIGDDIINALQDTNVGYFTETLSGLDPFIVVTNITTDLDGDHTSLDINFTYRLDGGPLYFDVDPSISDVVEIIDFQPGSYNVQGKAIVADNRFPDRSVVMGVLLNRPSTSVIDKSSKVLIMKRGLYRAPTTRFTPGTRYFLGYTGKTFEEGSQVIYPESIVEIGSARSDTELVIDVLPPTIPRGNDAPVGSVKSIPAGINTAEPGYGLMDGVTLYDRVEYITLYEILLAAYGAAEVDSGVSDFIIPELNNTINGNFYQIKLKNFGYQPNTPIVFTKSFTGTFDGTGDLPNQFDLSYLARIGTSGDNELPELRHLIIKLEVNTDGLGTWREITPYSDSVNGWGWDVDNSGVDQFGFTSYILSAIEYGTGLNHPSGGLANKEFRLTVYKPESLARAISADLAGETISIIDNLNPAAVNSIAVTDWVTAYLTDAIQEDHGKAFNADKVDTYHATFALAQTAFADDRTTPAPEQKYLITVETNGVAETGATLRFHLDNTDLAAYTLANNITSLEASDRGFMIRPEGSNPGSLGLGGLSSDDVYLLNNDGVVEVKSTDVPDDGSVNYAAIRASTFQNVSSKTAKAGIRSFDESALQILQKTPIKQYRLIADKNQTKRVGFIAEDTNELIAGPGHNVMDVTNTVGLLIKAVQELSQEIKELKSK